MGPIDTAGWRCSDCGCTDDDCSGCIERTGRQCYWVSARQCSACLAAKVDGAFVRSSAPAPVRHRNVGSVPGAPTWGCLGLVLAWVALWFLVIFPLFGWYHL